MNLAGFERKHSFGTLQALFRERPQFACGSFNAFSRGRRLKCRLRDRIWRRATRSNVRHTFTRLLSARAQVLRQTRYCVF